MEQGDGVVQMGRKGADVFVILNGRVKRPSGRVKASLAALQWAADRAGMRYGVFTQRLTPAEEASIQADYEA